MLLSFQGLFWHLKYFPKTKKIHHKHYNNYDTHNYNGNNNNSNHNNDDDDNDNDNNYESD